MSKRVTVSDIRSLVRDQRYQLLGFAFSLIFGATVIANTQMSGDAMWFWYATLLHHGTRLYADLHLALQPLFVLLTDAWLQLLGSHPIALAVPSIGYVFLLSGSIYLILRESKWADWQKGILLAGCFVLTTHFNAYLFNDYHVVADIFLFYAVALLLILARADSLRRQLTLSLLLGVLVGLTITTRVNDGGGLLVGTLISVLFLARARRLALAAVIALVAAATVLFVVHLTNDSFHDYINSTVIKAAASKGGSGSLLLYPVLAFSRSVISLLRGGRSITVWLASIVVLGGLLARYWKSSARYLLLAQLGFAAVTFALFAAGTRHEILYGAAIETLTLAAVALVYCLVPIVSFRWLRSLSRSGRTGSIRWDAREILVVVLFLGIAAGSTSSAGSPVNLFETTALLLLLIAVLDPFHGQALWANTSVVTLVILIGLTGVAYKVEVPYQWHNSISSAMFTNREFYRHPTYGPMYIERDLLNFVVPVCKEIGQAEGTQELLSLPYPYPNYFCGIPPWDGYVQTFFDTSTRATIVGLMNELERDPPTWIVYQRQMETLAVHERIYNHGQPLAQRDLDTLILLKINAGEWRLVDKKAYLAGDGWYIIRTKP